MSSSADMKALREKPVNPGYVAPAMAQVQEADAWVWEQIGQRCARGFRAADWKEKDHGRSQAENHPVQARHAPGP